MRASVPGALAIGPLAEGADDDLVLVGEFGKYVFETTLGGSPGSVVAPGALIDAQGIGGGQDGLIALTPGAACDGEPLEILSAKDVLKDATTGGALVSSGTLVTQSGRLGMTTRVVLDKALPHVVLVTEITNNSGKTMTCRPGDRLRFGAGAVVAGARGPQEKDADVDVRWIGHERVPQGYGYALDGQQSFLARFHVSERGGRSKTLAVDAMAASQPLAPGQKATFVRRFLATGDGLPGVEVWVAGLAGKGVGRLEGTINAPGQLDPGDFVLPLVRDGRFVGHVPVRTGLGIDMPLLPGRYSVKPTGPWGLSTGESRFEIVAGKTGRLDLSFAELAEIEVRITDADSGGRLPASVVVTREDGSAVSLGPGRTARRAGPTVHFIEGQGKLRLPPGVWTLTATRGPRYSIQTQTIDVLKKRTGTVFEPTLRRLVDLPGWVTLAPRVYSAEGAIGTAESTDVAAALVCGGIDAAALPHDRRGDLLAQALNRARLTDFITAIPALEATPIAPRIGTFMAVPADIAGSISPARGTEPEALLERLRASASANPFVTAIWPRSPNGQGYFDRFQLDRDTGLYTRGGATDNFDGVEVFSGESFAGADQGRVWRTEIEADWMALIGQGFRYTAIGASGSARLGVEPVGLPFTLVDVGSKRPKDLGRAIVDGLRDNRAVISTGPFVRFEIGGSGPGTLVTPRRRQKSLTATVEVVAPDWIALDRAILYADGKPIKRWVIDAKPKGGVVRFEGKHPIALGTDVWYHVRVFGDSPLPTAPHLGITPFAMTNAIWVDGDRSRGWEP